jgi:hypothetical protein
MKRKKTIAKWSDEKWNRVATLMGREAQGIFEER